MNTKLINQIQFKNYEAEYKKSKDDFSIALLEEYNEYEKEAKIEFEAKQNNLLTEIKKLLSDGLIFMDNMPVVYDNNVVALFPDFKEYKPEILGNSNCSISSLAPEILNFSIFKGQFMTMNECRNNSKELLQNKKIKKQAYLKSEKLLGGLEFSENSLSNEPGCVNPIYRLNGVDSDKLIDNNKILLLWIKLKLVPADLTVKSKKHIQFLIELYSQEMLSNNLELDWGKFKDQRMAKLRKIRQPKPMIDVITDKLLNCEKVRAAIDNYDIRILTDLNRGHWDLWEEPDDSKGLTKLEKELIARNPIADIKEGGIVGIDFGTKSTVVVHQEDRDFTLPMRVGTGDFSKKTEQSQYENPSVIELKDLQSFLQGYQEKEGRPETRWNDLTVSHTAFNSLVNSSSEEYYAYITDLKQWTDDRKRRMLLRDKKGNSIALTTFLELSDEDFNPIELYAYYLGLYINNMHNGIYLDYSLSFPVTYEKDVRLKILKSFENGIKKSLPVTIIKDEEIMKKFRVYMGASEPAAYAICALQEYGFEPTGDDRVFYGIFDFGGGTTDFDFGIWRESDKPRKYDFAIEHFGAGGDRYLGGENLLELLSFHIFRENEDILRDKKITFVLPPECNRFLGSETLLNESQEAKLNMKQVMEKVRPLWERFDGYEKEFEKGIIKVDLTDNEGKLLPNVELKIDMKELETILKERIEKGVKNFFESFRTSFNALSKRVDKLHIFLAGNASKSEFVNELFDEYIALESKAMNVETGFFELYSPLGTKEAYLKQKELGFERDIEDKSRPTGKTGVAFGLIESRKGGKIEVIDGNMSLDNEIKFKYFLGMNKRKKFHVLIDRDAQYNEWIEFADASEEDFELYYTELPEAIGCDMDIQKVERKKCRLTVTDEDSSIYLRRVSPTVVEYVVATRDGLTRDRYLSEITSVDLG